MLGQHLTRKKFICNFSYLKTFITKIFFFFISTELNNVFKSKVVEYWSTNLKIISFFWTYQRSS